MMNRNNDRIANPFRRIIVLGIRTHVLHFDTKYTTLELVHCQVSTGELNYTRFLKTSLSCPPIGRSFIFQTVWKQVPASLGDIYIYIFRLESQTRLADSHTQSFQTETPTNTSGVTILSNRTANHTTSESIWVLTNAN
jgi:hypothetical protein